MLFPTDDDGSAPGFGTRILLFTGKGGVGKTTCAAATAQRAARQGKKTLILSSDPAHSLADALDRDLGPEAQEIADSLFAQEVDLYYSMKKYWGNMRELMLTVFRWQGVDQIAAEEMAALPGMNEGSVLLWLEQALREEDYDLIVVDSAPTGETLTLLTLPQVTQWWLAKAFPFQKFAFKSFGFGVRKTTGIPLDKGYEELEVIFEKLERIQEVLATPETTSIRLVMNPEKMVIEEARRAYTYLQLYGYAVDSVVVNRVLPEDQVPDNSFFSDYVTSQRRYLEEIDQSFSPLPILQVPHLGTDVFGADRLDRIADAMYDDEDPTAVESRLAAAAESLRSIADPGPLADPPGIASRKRTTSIEEWRRSVTEAIERIDAGELRKVVLAQALRTELQSSLDVPDTLVRLERTYPECFRFLLEPADGGASFFGATPEQLVGLRGRTVETDALAGTTGRGDTPAEDEWLATELLEDEKNTHEHELVANAIRDQLAPYAASVRTGPRGIRRLETVQHIETPITAELSDDEHVLTLVEALHPTPAVGGLPPDAALATIRDTEPFERGWYAAPIGWFDAAGYGSFAVAIRSAIAREDVVTLFAGVGIVADSDPDREWDEVQLKYRPILDELE
jgi:arsenite-transporting ATPase